jgi:hypothetical protein
MDKSEQVAARLTRRVEALRAIASNVKDQESREAILDWAADYERLAERAIEVGTFSVRRG